MRKKLILMKKIKNNKLVSRIWKNYRKLDKKEDNRRKIEKQGTDVKDKVFKN